MSAEKIETEQASPAEAEAEDVQEDHQFEEITPPVEEVTSYVEEVTAVEEMAPAVEHIPPPNEVVPSVEEMHPSGVEAVEENTSRVIEIEESDVFDKPSELKNEILEDTQLTDVESDGETVKEISRDYDQSSLADAESLKSNQSDIDFEGEDIDVISEREKGSLMTQAGSYGSTSTPSIKESEDFISPQTFQDYVQKYAELFNKATAKEDVLCDEEAGKTFLKIDTNQLISGFATDNRFGMVVKETLIGMSRVKQDIVCVENDSIVFRSNYKSYKGVRTLSGGHMGKEPLFLEYVGKGMLTGVVLGTENNPPSVANVTKAMRELAVDSPGLLIIIQNNVEYRLIFGLAMERIRMEGFTCIDMIAVGDDCYERCKSPAGRRGLGGIVLMFKLAGSMADCQKSLQEIYKAVRLASKNIVTISCMTKPFKAIGAGLDKKSKEGTNFTGDLCQLVKKMLDYCLHPMRYFSIRVDPEDSLIVFINSYRNKSTEFYTVADYIVEELEKRKYSIIRVYADNFVSGFWPGFSISIMIDYNDFRAKFLDSPTDCSLWPRNPTNGCRKTILLKNNFRPTFEKMGPILKADEAKVTHKAIVAACKALILCECVLNMMHYFGNYGTKLRIGAEAIFEAARLSKLNFDRPFNLLIEISEILIEKIPGMTGAMYGCLFEGAARSFLRSPLTAVTTQNWSEALDEALKTLRAYTNAKGGIVTLALSFVPVVSAIHGPYTDLPQKSSKNPILYALECLRGEIEIRFHQSANEKESILKNQLDVESYAIVIWLHAVYSSIHWKETSDESANGVAGEAVKSESVLENVSRKISESFTDLEGINKSLDFFETTNDGASRASSVSGYNKIPSSAHSLKKKSSISVRNGKEGKIYS